MPESASRWVRKIAAWLTGRRVSWLLIALLAVDALFIVLHLLYAFTPLIEDPAFWLGEDRGYAEGFQYLKFAGLVVLFALLTWKKRALLYAHWTLLFAYLLVDDAWMLHEEAGEWLAAWWGLPGFLHLKSYHVGELLVSLFLGLFFLTTLTLTYRASGPTARRLSQDLILLLVLLVLFGVVVDLIHEMVPFPGLRTWLTTLEDGGENVVVSVILGFVFERVRRMLRWGERPEVWARAALQGALLFALFVALLAVVQYGTPGLIGNDGYYHAKMGLLVRRQGLTPTPPRLPLTILNPARFYDHHLLYHLYLALFAPVDPAVDGGIALTRSVKVASLLLPALAFVAFWGLLRQQGVPWASLWSLGLLALSEGFLYRMSMPRIQAPSLLILLLGYQRLLKGRHRWLLPLGFLYVWLGNVFPLLLVLAGSYVVAVRAVEGHRPWSALAYPALGILLGSLINPYFPRNLLFLGYHLLPKLGRLTVPVGIEWYPYAVKDLVQNAGLPFGAVLLASLALVRRRRRWTAHRGGAPEIGEGMQPASEGVLQVDMAALTALLMAIVTGLMVLKARRFVEYFPPFALVALAFSTAPLVEGWRRAHPRWRHKGPALALLVLLPLLVLTLRAARHAAADSPPADRYAAASLWLRAYSEPGSRVFQTDWDDFPRLFFYDSDKEYTIGLDPTYMALYNPSLYAAWVQITRGEVTMPSRPIREQFGADYVFTDREHEPFLRQAADDPGLQEIYRDWDTVIFQVVGEP